VAVGELASERSKERRVAAFKDTAVVVESEADGEIVMGKAVVEEGTDEAPKEGQQKRNVNATHEVR